MRVTTQFIQRDPVTATTKCLEATVTDLRARHMEAEFPWATYVNISRIPGVSLVFCFKTASDLRVCE